MNDWQRDVALSSRTTFGIGGTASHCISVGTEEELAQRVRQARDAALPITILGGGSNVLISDEGIDGAVIGMEIGGIEAEDGGDTVLVTAGAGVRFDEFVAYTVDHGWWGLENLSAIPGTVGAAPIQNIGAYGVEISELIESVRVMDRRDARMSVLPATACKFGYRDSLFKHEEGTHHIVTSVTLRLSKTPRRRLDYADLRARFDGQEPTQQEIRNAVTEIRAGKFPDWHTLGTAGSFFKNPIVPASLYERLQESYPELPGFALEDGMVKIPLGWILDRVCNLRGVREGNVGTYEKQALVLVNYGAGTARDMTTFAERIAQEVFLKTGITIEWEVTRV